MTNPGTDWTAIRKWLSSGSDVSLDEICCTFEVADGDVGKVGALIRTYKTIHRARKKRMTRTILTLLGPQQTIHPYTALGEMQSITWGGTLIMDPRTWRLSRDTCRSRQPLVISDKSVPGVETHPNLWRALAMAVGPVWFVGGWRLMNLAMPLTDRMIIEFSKSPGDMGKFPDIDFSEWKLVDERKNTTILCRNNLTESVKYDSL